MSEIFNTKGVDDLLSLPSKKLKEQKHVSHFNVKTIEEAVSLLKRYQGDAKLIAGGVDVVSLLKYRMIMPQVLVNIKTIPKLAYIKEDIFGLKIGTLTHIKDIETGPIIKSDYRILAEAARSVGSPLIKNMATICGNLCQDVRCWYYRRSPFIGLTFQCYRKGGKECFAVDGENQHHAIIGCNKCHSVNPSDMATALIALQAKLKIVSPDGEKILPIDQFYTELGNVLKPDEIITEIQVPGIVPNTKQKYLKFRMRKAIDFATSSVAMIVTTQDNVICKARIVLGGVAPIPYRSFKAERILIGKAITEEIAETAAKAALSEAAPLSQNAYKIPISETLIKRALLS